MVEFVWVAVISVTVWKTQSVVDRTRRIDMLDIRQTADIPVLFEINLKVVMPVSVVSICMRHHVVDLLVR